MPFSGALRYSISMLKMMRSNKVFTVFFLGVITVLITIVFVFWGIGPQQNPSEAIVAEVSESRITYPEYDRAYQIEYRRASETYESAEEIEKLNLRIRVLDQLIDERVLMITAERSEITVTDGEIRKAIMNEPSFQKDGVFNKEIYTRRLKLGRMTPSTFESQLRNDLAMNKIRRLIGETAELGVEEARMLESIKDNREQLTQAFLAAKRQLAVKAYIEGLKRQMKITVNDNFLSY
ncbi:MAG: SurA N-terminal domain-containing protein [Nitrospiraceae bacterium]|nr:MAG: SurA N-terminal domain-containing protein [Nitrospiraceae bacterium]